jgi:hypothetical protein
MIVMIELLENKLRMKKTEDFNIYKIHDNFIFVPNLNQILQFMIQHASKIIKN